MKRSPENEHQHQQVTGEPPRKPVRNTEYFQVMKIPRIAVTPFSYVKENEWSDSVRICVLSADPGTTPRRSLRKALLFLESWRIGCALLRSGSYPGSQITSPYLQEGNIRNNKLTCCLRCWKWSTWSRMLQVLVGILQPSR